jgi:hypothetical protein
MAVANSFNAPVSGGSFTPNTYEDYGYIIGKLAKTYIRNVEAKNPLALFDKGRIENGDTIEQIVVGLLESQAYDASGANTLTPTQLANIYAKYWNDWQKKVYKATLRPEQIRKIRPQYMADDTADLASKILGSLDRSAEHEHYVAFKELLTWGVAQNLITTASSVPQKDGATDWKGIIIKIKDLIDNFTFLSSNRNGAQINTMSNRDDICLVIPYATLNRIDVNELAGVFNLSKEELNARIIKTDANDNKIYVIDKNAILSFTREYEIKTQENAEGNFYNYFLHTERLLSISPLFNATMFTYA